MENRSGSTAVLPETWLYYSQIVIYAYSFFTLLKMGIQIDENLTSD